MILEHKRFLVIVNNMDKHDGMVGMQFPELRGKTLSGKEMVFPGSVGGLVIFLVIAFERNAQAQVDSWVEPFAKAFGGAKECAFFEVPMLAGGWKLFAGYIDGGMRSGIPAHRHDHVITYYGKLGLYTGALRMKDRSLCHCFLLDRKGIIRWTGKGFADAESLENMLDTTAALLGGR